MHIPDKAITAVLDVVKARDDESVIERDTEDYAAIAALVREDLEAAAPHITADVMRTCADDIEANWLNREGPFTLVSLIRAIRNGADKVETDAR